MQPALGFSLQNQYALPMAEVIALLRRAGFSAVSPVWAPDLDLSAIAAAVQEQRMLIQSLHAPHRGVNLLWSPDKAVSAVVKEAALRSIDACSRFQIPILVLHCWHGFDYSFREDDLHFGNFDQIVTHAQSQGVTIALENLEGEEFLRALLARYRDVSTVGFCWDSGHALCYAPTRDFLKDYGDRLVMTHLNDNFGITAPDGHLQGTDDLHLLPFDGKLDWTDAIRQLKQAKRQNILNFELKIRPKGDRCTTDLYSRLPLEQYISLAFARATRAVAAYFE